MKRWPKLSPLANRLARRCASVLAWAALLTGALFAADDAPQPPAPADPEVRVESTVDRADVKMGDIITYSLKITAKEGVSVTPPEAGVNLGQFEIQDFISDPPRQEKGFVVHEARYKIAVYEVGEHIIPPVTVKYSPKEGGERTLESEALTINVKSLAPEDAKEFRDIKQPISTIPNRRRLYILLAALAGFLILAGFAAWLWHRRQLKRRGWTPPLPPPRPPVEIALEELDKLERSNLLEERKIKEFFVKLSDIIRVYLGARFGFDAKEQTTDEVMAALDAVSEPTPDEAVKTFLSDCDLVKFARWEPALDRSRQMLTEAREIIGMTRPSPLAPAAAPAAAGKEVQP